MGYPPLAKGAWLLAILPVHIMAMLVWIDGFRHPTPAALVQFVWWMGAVACCTVLTFVIEPLCAWLADWPRHRCLSRAHRRGLQRAPEERTP
jgi:hypothetical protein